MYQSFIGIHAALGEVGSFAFLWIFVELLNPTEERIERARKAALVGFAFLVASWFSGGYYYLEHYGVHVKPIIEDGPTPWSHGVFMETKEHIFLFLPFLALFAYGVLRSLGDALLTDLAVKRAALGLSALIFLMGMSMAGMGYLVSIGARLALEGNVAL